MKIARGESCPKGEKCRQAHDVEKFLSEKSPDISETCYLFNTYGRCRFGYLCRFAGAHIKDGVNVIEPEKNHESLPINFLRKEIQIQLRKRGIPFPKSTPLIKENGEQVQKRVQVNNSQIKIGETTLPDLETNQKENLIIENEVPYVETRLKFGEKKQIDWGGKLYCAPLTTVGNLPYRRIVKKFGADITCGEMAMATNLLQGKNSEWALLRRHPSEDLFGVQICGSHMNTMTQCSELLDSEISYDFLDINCGCPIDLVYNKGAGSALIENPRRLESIVTGVSMVNSHPVTVKLRIGKDEKNPTVHNIIPSLQDWGAQAVTLHGRSRQQRYTKLAHWDYIHECSKISKIPLIGNGDIYNWQQAMEHMEQTKISSVMLARGALIKPWLFTEIKERRDWDISASERFEMIKDYANFGLDHWGSDQKGVNSTREFLCQWLSFLYRYVPVGLLEHLPSKLNDRPRPYFGRSDMETLLASPAVSDWLKISEMILGPTPDNFIFVPKHKSNAWESNG